MRTSPAEALQQAKSLHRAGDLSTAEAKYRALLAAFPNHGETLYMLGHLLLQSQRLGESIDIFTRAVAAAPSVGQAHAGLAEALRLSGQIDRAIERATAAIALDPNLHLAHHTLGLCRLHRSEFALAEQSLGRAVQLQPGDLASLVNLGTVLVELGKTEAAIATQNQALALAPTEAEPHNIIGKAKLASGDLHGAADSFREAIRLRPAHASAWHNLGNALRMLGLIDEAIPVHEKAISLRPDVPLFAATLRSALHFADLPAAKISAAIINWGRRYADPITAQFAHRRFTNAPDPDRRLRVGYISPDFRWHPVASFLEPLLAAHDRDQFEIFLYHDSATDDSMTKRLARHAAQWRPIAGMSDDAVDEQIRRDQIDVLIDLAGHTEGNRLLMFARRCAPVQMSYLGWQNTTGVRAIDFRISDVHADPVGRSESQYVEKLLRLPETVAVIGTPHLAPEISQLPALRNGFVTFASFARLEKLSPRTLQLWSRVLSRLSGSRLLLFAPGLGLSGLQDRLRRDLSAAGEIGRDRIEFSAPISFPDFLAVHSRIDLILDTFPVNGHTTICNSLWMGVPTITLAGDRYAGRLGLSVMTNLGLPQFVAQSGDEFVDRAQSLASDLDALASLRASLRDRMSGSALMNAPEFARQFERLLRQAWQDHLSR